MRPQRAVTGHVHQADACPPLPRPPLTDPQLALNASRGVVAVSAVHSLHLLDVTNPAAPGAPWGWGFWAGARAGRWLRAGAAAMERRSATCSCGRSVCACCSLRCRRHTAPAHTPPRMIAAHPTAPPCSADRANRGGLARRAAAGHVPRRSLERGRGPAVCGGQGQGGGCLRPGLVQSRSCCWLAPAWSGSGGARHARWAEGPGPAHPARPPAAAVPACRSMCKSERVCVQAGV